MKNMLFIFIFSVFSAMAWGQGSVSRLTFTSGGKASTNAGITIGEPILGRSSQVTLGSQQGTLDSTVGIKEIKNSALVSVFPNPFTNEFTVTVKGIYENNFSVRVVNLMGQEIFFQKGLSKSYSCNLNKYPQSPYFIIVLTPKGEKIISKTLIKI